MQDLRTALETMPAERRLHALRGLPSYLSVAGRRQNLRELLLNFTWLQAKLKATDVNTLIVDYAYLPEDDSLRVVQSALRVASHTLTADDRQLAGQLFGRLVGSDFSGLPDFLDSITSSQQSVWMRPFKATLPSPRGPLLQTLTGHTATVNAVAVTPDGRQAISASNDRTIRVWDLESGKTTRIIKSKENRGYVRSLGITPDNECVAATGRNVLVWNIETGKQLCLLTGHTAKVNAVVVTPDGRNAISGSDDGTLRLWDVRTGEQLREFQAHESPVIDAAIVPTSGHLLSLSKDKSLRLWDIQTGKELRQIVLNNRKAVNGVAALLDGKHVLTASNDQVVTMHDLELRDEVCWFRGHVEAVRAVEVLPDGKRALSCSDDKTLRLWNLEDRKEPSPLDSHDLRQLRVFTGHAGAVTAVTSTHDGKHAISASLDGTVRVWNLEAEEDARRFEGHMGTSDVVLTTDGRKFGRDRRNTAHRWIERIVLTPDGQRAVSVASDHSACVWDIEAEGRMRACFYHPSYPFQVHTHLAVTPNGRYGLALYDSATSVGWWAPGVYVWDLDIGETLRRLETCDTSRAKAIFATPDGERALAVSSDETVHVWDILTGEIVHYLKGYGDDDLDEDEGKASWETTRVLLVPDGKKLISVMRHGAMHVWNIGSGESLHFLEPYSGGPSVWEISYPRWAFKAHGPDIDILYVAVTPDGQRVVSVDQHGTLRVWDLDGGEVIHILHTNAEVARHWHSDSVDVTPGGETALFLASETTIKGGRQQTIHAWDFRSGERMSVLQGHTAGITSFALLPSGRHAVSAAYDSTLRLWDVRSGELLDTFTAEDNITSLDVTSNGRTVVAGDASGQIHFLHLENV